MTRKQDQQTQPKKKASTNWTVLKFGGTSVSTPKRWHSIVRILSHHIANGRRPLVVCSAVSGVTNCLESCVSALAAGDDPSSALAAVDDKQLTLIAGLGLPAGVIADARAHLDELVEEARDEGLTPRRRARILSMGEVMSTRIGVAWLSRQDFDARWIDARDLLLAEPPLPGMPEGARYLSASCGYEPDDDLIDSLAGPVDEIIVTQGFIARDEHGDTVLLGRGGSDTSASYIAARLRAAGVEIWTDVPGLFTANPNRYPGARLIREVTSLEAEVMAAMGAKVLHPRCLQPLREHGIPARIGWTDRPEVEGTHITPDAGLGTPGALAVSSRGSLCLLTMRRDASWQPVGFMAGVAECFTKRGLSMDLIASSPSEIRATIDLSAYPDSASAVVGLVEDLREICEPELKTDISSVSVIGSGMGLVMGPISNAIRRLGGQAWMTSHAANDAHLSVAVDNDVAVRLSDTLHHSLFERTTGSPRLGPAWRELMRQTGPDPVQVA